MTDKLMTIALAIYSLVLVSLQVLPMAYGLSVLAIFTVGLVAYWYHLSIESANDEILHHIALLRTL